MSVSIPNVCTLIASMRIMSALAAARSRLIGASLSRHRMLMIVVSIAGLTARSRDRPISLDCRPPRRKPGPFCRLNAKTANRPPERPDRPAAMLTLGHARRNACKPLTVIPAKAGSCGRRMSVHPGTLLFMAQSHWIPAFAGMTVLRMTVLILLWLWLWLLFLCVFFSCATKSLPSIAAGKGEKAPMFERSELGHRNLSGDRSSGTIWAAVWRPRSGWGTGMCPSPKRRAPMRLYRIGKRQEPWFWLPFAVTKVTRATARKRLILIWLVLV